MKSKKYIKLFAIGLIKYTVTGLIVAAGILAFSYKEKNVTRGSDKIKIEPGKIKINIKNEQSLQAINKISK
jgi:hypothetical protein